MYKIFKFPWEQRNQHFWSSDWHIFHDPKWNHPIWKTRGYKSAEDASKKIQDKINERVGKNDTLWYLGDMFLNASDEQCLKWIDGLNCENINVIKGNHESNIYRLYKKEVLKQFGRDDIEVYPLKMGKITFYGNHLEIQLGKKNIVMNHFPIHSWNGMGGRKSWMIHGHSHNNDKTRNPNYPINNTFDCSWDWKCDVWSFEEIEDIMSTKSIEIYDHHGD